jgi:hypothetical protein
MPVRIVKRLRGGRHRKDDEVIDLALFFRLHPIIGIEGAVGPVAARNHAGDLAGQIRNVECIDLLGTALTGKDALPGRLDAIGQRRHHAQTRDDNPPHLRSCA